MAYQLNGEVRMSMEETGQALSLEQQKLIVDNHVFSKKLSSKFMRRAYAYGFTNEEIESAAAYGLCLSALRFQSNGGSKFSTYAFLRINGEIQDLLRGKRRQRNRERNTLSDTDNQCVSTRKPRGGIASEFGDRVGYDVFSSSSKQGYECAYVAELGPEDQSVQLSAKQILQNVMKTLPPAAAFMIEQHYFQHRPMEEVRKELGLPSRIAAFRLHRKALGILKQELEKQSLKFDDFLSLLN